MPTEVGPVEILLSDENAEFLGLSERNKAEQSNWINQKKIGFNVSIINSFMLPFNFHLTSIITSVL